MAHFVHARCQPSGTVIQLSCGAGDGVDHPLVTGLHRVERTGHLPDFVRAGQRHTGREVAGFFNVEHDVFQRIELAEQKADQQLRRTEHRQHQDEHRHGVVGETFFEHLAQARAIGNHGDVLAVGTREHFGAHQRVFAEQRHRVDLDPAVAVRQFQHGLIVEQRRVPATERQQVIGLGQRLPGRPGAEQACLCLGGHFGCVTAGLLFELYGVQHQQQGRDEGDSIDRPEFIFQRDVAKPGTHGGLL
ncbi:hypothetical protein D3C84_799640 [compost metagenome]